MLLDKRYFPELMELKGDTGGKQECLDELNQKILRGYTKELTAACNKDGVWEVQAKI